MSSIKITLYSDEGPAPMITSIASSLNDATQIEWSALVGTAEPAQSPRASVRNTAGGARNVPGCLEGECIVTAEETGRLVVEMGALPPYRGWGFTYEGYFCFSHSELPYSVFCTPNWCARRSTSS